MCLLCPSGSLAITAPHLFIKCALNTYYALRHRSRCLGYTGRHPTTHRACTFQLARRSACGGHAPGWTGQPVWLYSTLQQVGPEWGLLWGMGSFLTPRPQGKRPWVSPDPDRGSSATSQLPRLGRSPSPSGVHFPHWSGEGLDQITNL